MGNSQAKRREEASDLKDDLLHRAGAADARAQGRGQDNGDGLPGGGEPQDGGAENGGAEKGSGRVKRPSLWVQVVETMERYKKDGCKRLHPLLPIPDECMIEMLPTYATIALPGLTTFNLMVATTVAPNANKGIVQALLYMCPYTYIPFGVAAMILATVATKCRRFAGAAAGLMLVQLLYVLLLGGFSTIIKVQSSSPFDTKDTKGTKEDTDKGAEVVFWLTIALCCIVFVFWCLLLPYPKCLSLWSYIRAKKSEGFAAALAFSAQASEAADVALRAAKDAAEVAEVANSDAKSAKEAADAAIAAEGAEDQAEEAASKAKQAARGAEESAVVAEKAAGEASNMCNRARTACEDAEKLLESARVFEEKARILSDPSNRV